MRQINYIYRVNVIRICYTRCCILSGSFLQKGRDGREEPLRLTAERLPVPMLFRSSYNAEFAQAASGYFPTALDWIRKIRHRFTSEAVPECFL